MLQTKYYSAVKKDLYVPMWKDVQEIKMKNASGQRIYINNIISSYYKIDV